MKADLDDIAGWAGGFLQQLQPTERRKLMRAVATELRRRQSKRIAEQRNPDGSAYEPRKPRLRARAGRVRRQMFGKLRTAKFLKIQAGPDRAVVEFAGSVRRMAEVHQFGLRDRVNRKGGLEVEYARRELLGFGEGDVGRLADVVFRSATS